MIELDAMQVRFGRFTAVDALSLRVPAGELFGFLGPNGAGKTTTMRVLSGALRASSGQVRVAGCELPRELDRLKPRMACVPDVDTHYEDLSGRENLQLFARLYGVDPRAVEAWLARVELSEAADLKVRSYSRGMKKKLLIARALMHGPQVIFLDEPTAHLDRQAVSRVHALLREQVAEGRTVFLSTHDMDEVEALCDRVALIAHGRLLACDTPARLIARHAQRWCEVQYEHGGRSQRLSLRMDDDAERAQLATLLRSHPHLRMHTREPSFEEVFRSLTAAATAARGAPA